MIKRKESIDQKLKKLNNKIQDCQKCELANLIYNIKDISQGYGKLWGWRGGKKKCRFFFVGMNPSYNRFPNIEYAFGGRDFDKGTGVEFVNYLKELDLIDYSYVTNLVKCSTKTNRIESVHFDNCFEHLYKEYEILKPEKILAMGRDAHTAIMMNYREHEDIISRLHSIWHPNYVMSYNRNLISEYKRKIKEICR